MSCDEFKYFEVFLAIHGCKYNRQQLIDYVLYLYNEERIGVPERDEMLRRIEIHIRNRMTRMRWK